MRKYTVAMLLFAMSTAGCNQGNPGGQVTRVEKTSPTSQKTTTTANKPILGEADRTFSLSLPSLSTRLKQGETKTITIGISRGKNFDQDVSLQLNDLPQGVAIEPGNLAISHAEKDVSVRVSASPDAALGDFSVRVVGHPGQGVDATNDLKLTIIKAD